MLINYADQTNVANHYTTRDEAKLSEVSLPVDHPEKRPVVTEDHSDWKSYSADRRLAY